MFRIVLDKISGLQDNPISSVVMSGLVLVHFVIQVSAKPLRTLRSKFASSYSCKNVSRKGAKEQREKRIALTLSLLLCAFAGNVWLWLCCSVSLAVSVSTYITAETPRTQRLHRDLKLNNVRLAD